MFIQTKDTPNPATLQFLPGREVMGDAPPADFPNPQAAAASPLAQALFEVDGVVSVFFGQDFISISKAEGHEWQHLKPALLSAIMEHFVAARPLWAAGYGGYGGDASPVPQVPQVPEEDIRPEDAEIVAAIKHILDTRVRPAVAQDGGDVVFHAFQNGVVSLHMRGACAGCPSATATLKHGIENLLKHYIPQVNAVRPVI